MPDVRVEDANGIERVLIGNIGTDVAPDYGLRVTSADGTTVIIDGTSDMFRIQATGTISQTQGNGTVGPAATTTLTALGNLAETPAHQSFVGSGTSGASTWEGGFEYDLNQLGYVAVTSGGAVTTRVIPTTQAAQVTVDLTAGPNSTARVSFTVGNTTGGNITLQARYYIIKQVSI